MKFRNGIEYSSKFRGGIEYSSVFRNNTEYGGVIYDYRNFDVSPPTLIPQTGTPAPDYWPDGSIIALKNNDDNNFAIYMSNRFAIRMTGSTPYVEDKMGQLVVGNRVFGEGLTAPIAGFTDDGVWFIGMHRTGGNNLIGFFHAESGYSGPQFDAYRNIGVTYSTDNGLTWSTPEKIIAPDYTKPVEITNSGVGDGCVVWNHVLQKYIAYYMPHATFRLAMAASDTGASGDWFKWDGEDFTVEAYNSTTGIGGADGTIAELSSYSGRNPQVMWNETLEKWVMVIGGWDGTVGMSTSDDGITWTPAFMVTDDQIGNTIYPSLVSDKGSEVGNTTMKLYHGRNMNPETVAREFVVRDLQYTPYEPYILPIPETEEDSYVINVGGSEYTPLLNKPDYVVDAEWRIATTTGFVYSRNPDGLTIDSSTTGSPTDGPVPIFIRFTYHGYFSDWKQITFEVVEP